MLFLQTHLPLRDRATVLPPPAAPTILFPPLPLSQILVHSNKVTQQFIINVLLLVVYAAGAGIIGYVFGPKAAQWTGLFGIIAILHALWVVFTTPPGASSLTSGAYSPLPGNTSNV